MRTRDKSKSLTIQSPLDGTRQEAVLRRPAKQVSQPIPLIYAPHPFTWSVEEDYTGGCEGLKAAGHRGWLNIPSEFNLAVLQPVGHHRKVQSCSMGYRGVVDDLTAWIDAVEEVVALDRDRIYACGLSMGGLESLLVAGHHPKLFAGVFVFNSVVDTEAWLEDLLHTKNEELRAEGGDQLIVTEVGGTPEEVPEEYTKRSAFAVLDGLATLPIKIWWSHLDLVVPRQIKCHGKHLYDELKRRDVTAPVSEYNHTARFRLSLKPTDSERWGIHESSDYHFATQWLLLHRRRLKD